ncbi:MAG: MBOAT family protein [Clostridia bacterium]|nr:MBOAT family protein [Clostridia bacterium]
MVFSGLTFLLLFLPSLLILYFMSRDLRWRNGVLVIFSLLFYAWGEPIMVLLLIGTTLFNYLIALLMVRTSAPGQKKLCLVLGVAGSLAGLLYFKYAGFFLSTLESLLSVHFSFAAPRLPIGISFYTFQILTYTVDVYRGKAGVQKSFWRLLLYVSCFPQLIAGPIVQYADVALALDERLTTGEDFFRGMRRFLLGLGKKVLLANTCGSFLLACLPAGAAPKSIGGAWLSALLYSLQLYFDFSAYSDMAIGLGRVLGFTYKENFLYPYVSVSPTEFWRRWHISLGSFFRDYVYIPLGGSRRGKGRRMLNLLVVWALTGLWHGAAWNFVLWGLYWFLLLVIDKDLSKLWDRVPKLFRWLFTLLAAVVGWTIFYYTDMPALTAHLSALFGQGVTDWLDEGTLAALRQYALFLPLACLAAMPLLPRARAMAERHPTLLEPLGTLLAVAVGLASLLFLVRQSYNPFIYFRF